MIADVTIGMVTYNRLELTKKTFAGALTNTGKKFNLIIADNASTDGTQEWLESNIKSLPNLVDYKFKFLSKNYGVAYGRNVCLKITRDVFQDTKYLCTLDNDVEIPNANWLQDCCDVLDANDKFGCCAVNFEKKQFPFTTVNSKGRQIGVRLIKNTPGTACSVFRKSDADKIGYFKRYNSGVYGHEDAWWHFSLKAGLNKVLLYLDSPGIHLGEGEYDVGEYREMKTKQFNENYNLFVQDIRDYSSGRKSLYIDFKEEE